MYHIISCHVLTYSLIIPLSGPTLPVNSTMTTESLPSDVFESLLPKLLSILQVTQRPEGTSNVRNKQDLLQAVGRAVLILTTLS